MLNINKNKK